MDHLVFAIIKAQAVPGWMLASFARIKELVRVSSIVAKSFDLIFHGVRMDNIHNYSNTHFMSSVNEFLQLLGSTEAT